MSAATDANVQLALERVVQAALGAVDPDLAGEDPILRVADPRFGDFQSNAAIPLAKRLGTNPRELASRIVGHLDVTGMADVEVTGPGFITFRLDAAFLGSSASAALRDDRLGVPLPSVAERVVLDYSAPNLAKEMHVGHLRTTIIGDAIARTLSFCGHDVVRQNHFGDWGTQFGMLIEHLAESRSSGASIADLDAFYVAANERFQNEEGFAERARARVVELQSGNSEARAMWRSFVDESLRHADGVYSRLGISLTRDDARAESSYNDDLEDVVSTMLDRGIARYDQGAVCIFLEGFAGRDGTPSPLIIQKSDGGYLYATTDLAAVRHRALDLRADRIVYVIDARQSRHLEMVFAAARLAGWLDHARVDHAEFGVMLGEDGKPFRTRDGEVTKLDVLLDEAEERALALVRERSPSLSESEHMRIARAVGVGAVKYGDLSNDRTKDYVFSWERMLRFDGNTGPYLQYAHSRTRSILRNAGDAAVDADEVAAADIVVVHEAERELVLRLSLLSSIIADVDATLKPHKICTFLFDVASSFMRFYENCPVLRAESPQLVRSRLALTLLTGRTIALGLGLLGIEALESM